MSDNDDAPVTPLPSQVDPAVFKKVVEGDRSGPQPMRETRDSSSE